MATASTSSKTSSAQASASTTQTEMSTAIQESKTGTITRDFAAFSIFKKPEMITGIKGLVTLQPLNKGKEAGWFLDSESLETCKWTATADDFGAGRAIFNYTHTFGRGDKRNEKRGVLLTNPKLQVVMKSQLLIEEKGGMNQIIGAYQDNVELYEADRELPSLERKYQTRVKYLVFVLKEDNTPAHANPIVLTLKNLNSVDMDKKHKQFMDQMQRALSLALGEDHPLLRGPKFSAVTVFDCKLGFECVGMNDTEVVNIVDFKQPDMSSVEAAQQSIMELTVPDTAWEGIWKLQESEAMQNYIQVHSMQDAARLGGRYGVAPGVNLLPEHVANKQLAAGRDKYGADASF